MSAPITSDPVALRDYLVRLATEAIDAADDAPLSDGGLIVTARGRELVLAHLRERMAQAAQTIVCEVEEARASR